ncbi:type IV secretion system protein [Actinomadura sp. NAK00032]|uniref:type IV secretion system protein n=1 Tax=Actinomadura sp. NAK00032 TaxID=2742128 RepID=UPI00159295C1|nr:type IV secretion system protein [Actinomadura sp. NAK00032]QKW34146.1 type IV secretion system protein [Actinomadura sp. NAK00032]
MRSPRHGTARLQRSPGEGLDPAVLDRPGRRRRRRPLPRTRRSVLVMLVAAIFVVILSPMASAGPFSPNSPCRPADNPAPEQYGSGTDGLIKPPDYPNEKLQGTSVEQLTYYDRYGTAGQTWYAVDMDCSDAMALMGNALANTTFTIVRAIDRTTISVYQAAASDSLLGWLKDTVDGVISNIGKTFNARYWSWVVILGAMWLAWWGLVRKRASKVTEGVIWMVAAMVALVWLIARPADFTTLGTKTSEATSAAFNAALPQSDTKGGTCIPRPDGKPDPATSQNLDATTRNANGLWVALVCKPWLQGEFGTTDPNAKIVKENADKLLWSQAVDLPETYGGNKVDLGKKADAYKDVTKNIKDNYPQSYSLFQGKNWQNRLAVAFGGLFAALVAGLLIMVIAIALIVVKIAFLLLLVAGPIFLGIGIHPGIGRVIAVRWLELLLSMLLKQAALIGVLSLLLWAYSLILGETLPWGLQVLLIALVTFAAFIYRKPFQHLFSAVGYSAVGSREKSEAQLNKSVTEARRSTTGVAAAVVPGAAGYRLGRWAKREATSEAVAAGAQGDAAPGSAVAVADRRTGAGAGDGPSPEEAPVLAAKPRGAGGAIAASRGRSRRGAPPLNLPTRAGALGDRTSDGGGAGTSARPGGVSAAKGGGGAAAGGGKPSSGNGPGTVRPTSWSGRGGSGGGASGGGSSGGGNGGSGGGGGWFAGVGRGRSGGGSNGNGGSGGGSGGSGGSGGGAPAANIPRQRGGTGNGGSSGASPSQGPGGRQQPPPLWGGGRRGSGEGPPIPFWLRPVDRPAGEPERDE